ncbi:hypothetical protein KFL_001440140 [Klebsormidium nitens]|uniref:Uncharacterized protein n=1 Tax=Klebsormidium nitens TaxID=105231 RepID=A0A1Y1I3L1_KLENI|nr:hypothetical protein KFL_001440140 [Klebsormidium nitens]|eukprot:GAQ83326.1 hypothetical protein KFL_001440140 [Klebsormidium nitens]
MTEQYQQVAFTGGGHQPVVVSLWGHSPQQGHALTKLVCSIDAFIDSSAADLVTFAGGTRLSLDKQDALQLPEVWIAERRDFQDAKFESETQPLTLIPKAIIETGAFNERFDVLTFQNKNTVTLSRGPIGGVVWRAMGYYKAGVENVLLIDVHRRRLFLVIANGSVQLFEWNDAIELELLPGYRAVMADLCKEETLGKQCVHLNLESKTGLNDMEAAVFERQPEKRERCDNDADIARLWGALIRASKEEIPSWSVQLPADEKEGLRS